MISFFILALSLYLPPYGHHVITTQHVVLTMCMMLFTRKSFILFDACLPRGFSVTNGLSSDITGEAPSASLASSCPLLKAVHRRPLRRY